MGYGMKYTNIILGSILLFSLIVSSAYADYRVPITIESDIVLEDYPVSFSLNTEMPIKEKKMNRDCSDIRVLHKGKELPLWIEGECNDASTTVWVKVPSLTPREETELFVSYGNKNLDSVSSPEAIFEFFDDFDGSDIDSSRWESIVEGDANIVVRNGVLRQQASAGYAEIASKDTFDLGIIIERKVKITANSSVSHRNRFRVDGLTLPDEGVFSDKSTSTSSWWSSSYGKRLAYFWENYLYSSPGDGKYFIVSQTVGTDSYTIDFEKGAKSSYSSYYSTKKSEALSGQETDLVITSSVGDKGSVAYGGDITTDWIRVRKYTEKTPLLSVGKEEEIILGMPAGILKMTLAGIIGTTVLMAIIFVVSRTSLTTGMTVKAQGVGKGDMLYLGFISVGAIGILLPWVSVSVLGFDVLSMSGWEINVPSDTSSLLSNPSQLSSGMEGIPVGKILFFSLIVIGGLFFVNKGYSFVLAGGINTLVAGYMMYLLSDISEKLENANEALNGLGSLSSGLGALSGGFGSLSGGLGLLGTSSAKNSAASFGLSDFLGFGLYLTLAGLIVSAVTGGYLLFSRRMPLTAVPSTASQLPIRQPLQNPDAFVSPQLRQWVMDRVQDGYSPDQIKNMLYRSSYPQESIDQILREISPP